MATWKNFEFKMWLKEINASCLSQEKLKLEAMKFSEKFDNVDKKTISKICDDFDPEFGHKLTLFAIKTSVVFLSVDVHFFAINSNKVALAARDPWL